MATGLGVDIHPYYQRGVTALPGVEYGWIKMADGAQVYYKQADGKVWTADAHAALFRRLGIPFGGYEFAELGTDGAYAFDVLWGECQRLGGTGVAPAVDIEGAGWNPTNATERGRAFCARARARGVRPAVYMDLSLLQACRPDEWPEDPVIWAPRYGAAPQVGGRYTGRYDVHQYSSSGTLPGSAGAVDWNQSYSAPGQTPGTAQLTTSEEDMPLNQADLDAIRDVVRYKVLATGHDANNPDAATPDVWTFGGRNIADVLLELLNRSTAAQASIDGLAAAVAALSHDPGITVDAVKQIVTDAVAQHVQITGEVHIGPATSTAAAGQ